MAMFWDKLSLLSENLSRLLVSENTNATVLEIIKKGRYIRNFLNVGRLQSNLVLTVVNCIKEGN